MEKGANDEFWVEESKEQLQAPMKSKRKVKPKKMEFDGWGSKPIIEFLKSIGRETVNQPSLFELTMIINDYVKKNNLLHPIKKKRVMCDEWLHYLFGKKWVPRIKISNFLEPHFLENYDESEDEDSYSSEEKEENEKRTASQKQKAPSLDKNTPQLKQIPKKPKSVFASIIPENMERVYLRRSLVQELLSDPENFEDKVVGSYVRIKSDPNDYSQKNSHQLLQVTGVRKASKCGDGGVEIFLEVPNLIKEVKVSMLSDGKFCEEECDDLHQRIKASSFKRPTVVEFQEKAQVLHEVITKQWLVKELSVLQNLIDRANEKGWRRELFEYLERKQLLQKPSEQERLLREVPKIIAEDQDSATTYSADLRLSEPVEETEQLLKKKPAKKKRRMVSISKLIAEDHEPKATLLAPAELLVNQENSFLPNSIVTGASRFTSFNTGANQNLSKLNLCGKDASGFGDASIPSRITFGSSFSGGEGYRAYISGTLSVEEKDENKQLQQLPLYAINSKGVLEKFAKPVMIQSVHEAIDTRRKGSQVDSQKLSNEDSREIVDHPESVIWYCVDAQGSQQGPFSMSLLRRWKDLNYFPAGFMVWKKGQSAVMLEDLIRKIFLN